jgi:hypothetical protein
VDDGAQLGGQIGAERHQTGRELRKDLTRLRGVLTGVTAVLPTDSGTLEPLPTPAGPSTAVLAAPARRCWLRWAVALSLLLAAGAGAGLGLLHRQGWFARPADASAPSANADLKAVESLVTLQKREQVLKDSIEQHANPGKDPNQIRTGLGLCVELGLLYLDPEQWRLEEAEQFFLKLEGSPVEAYQEFGRLGRAMVLAFQDRAGESNKLLLKLFPERPPRLNRYSFLSQSPQLKQVLARALDYNEINTTARQQLFPPPLQALRKQLTLPPGKPKNGKATGKNP